MKNFLVGRKTFITMGVALAAALYSYFVEPIPMVDDKLWAIAVPLVGIALRFATHQPVSLKDLLSAGKAINDARGMYNNATESDEHEGIGA